VLKDHKGLKVIQGLKERLVTPVYLVMKALKVLWDLKGQQDHKVLKVIPVLKVTLDRQEI
jgi:hypothetical protein